MNPLMKLSNIPAALRENGTNVVEYYGSKTYLKKTYSEVYIDVMKTLAFINKHGLTKGDNIGIIGGNSYEYMVVDLAVIIGGYVSIPFPEKDFRNRLESLHEMFALKLLFSDHIHEENSEKKTTYHLEMLLKLVENEKPEDAEVDLLNEEDVFTVLFTSGTTGFPKGVEMRVKCVEEWISTLLDRFEFSPDDKVIDFLPLSISNARLFVYGAILIQFDLVITTPEQLLRVLSESKPTILQGVPYLFETIYGNIYRNIKSSILKYSFFQVYLLIKEILPRRTVKNAQQKLFGQALRFWGGRMRIMVTGSAPISKKILKFYDDIGLRIYEAYGINEIGLVAINSPGAYRRGSVGKPFHTKEVKISEEGEILVRSDYCWGRGYINDNEGFSNNIFRKDGFVSTGDTGYFDKDRFLYIDGRLKEIIVLANGEKIHPNIIEQEMKNFPYINQVVAIGNQKPFISCILVLDDKNLSKSKIQEAVNSINKKLPDALNIKGYIIAREPFTIKNGLLNSTLKVNRNNVYKVYKKEIEALYE